MYNRILVPLDGSTTAEMVLPYVEEIAARYGAAVYLVSVSEMTNANLDNVYRPYLDRLMTQVEYDLGNFKAKKETAVYTNVLTGKAAAEIVRYAEENDINLIAMTASGSSGEGPLLLGNIAAKVLRATSRPVLLVKNPAAGEAIKQKGLIRKVLVPLDGSELGESAIPQVEALAKALDIEVILLQIVEPIIIASMPDVATVAAPTARQEASRQTAVLDYLDKIEMGLRKSGLSVSSALRSGSAAQEIISFADENNIDLIAMSTHGRSGIGRWVFGSITDKVLHAGNIPVLTVRAARQ
ncbi:MAG: universal stress protein [Dehalococcoidia bacterium]